MILTVLMTQLTTLKKRLYSSKIKTINPKKNKLFKTLTTIKKPFDVIVVIATSSGSITLFLTGVGLIGVPISNAAASGLSTGKKVIYEIVMQK